MAKTIIEDLVTQLSFQYDDKELKKFDGFVKSAVKGLTAIVTVAASAAAGMFAFSKKIAEVNDEIGKFSQRTGIRVEALQELGYVSELNGASIESMNGSLESLSKLISEASRGIGSGVEIFGMLGLSATDSAGNLKTADNMLLEISDSISKLSSQAEKLEFSGKLGISPDVLLSIQNGSKALMEQRKEARELGFVIDENATKIAADFNDEMLRVTKVVSGVANAIGTGLMKQIIPVMKIFVEWFKVNKKLIQQRIADHFQFLVRVIKSVYAVGLRVFAVFEKLVDVVGGWENAIKIATAALIALNASALFIPILMTAIAAAIFLLVEDIIKFAEGGDSALGNLAKRFPVLEAVLWTIIDLFKMIVDGWKAIFNDGETFINDLVDTLKEFADQAESFFVDPIENGINKLKEFGDRAKEFFLTPIEKGIDLLNKLPFVNIGANTNPVPSAVAGGAQNNTTNNTVNNTSKPNINITVNGGNPQDVKKVITDVLNEQYSGAVENLGSSVEF